ncbi:MAG TPA: IPT/TIG domain-containing protein [Holophagaceae bacterium]
MAPPVLLALLLLGAAPLACGGGGGDTLPAPIPAPVAAPTLSGFSPTAGVVGSTVTLAGTALTGTTKVTFGGAAATTYTVKGDAEVQAVVPPGASTGPIALTTAGGTATTLAAFTVEPSPVPILTGFNPLTGPVGTAVSLMGTGLTGASAVSFGGVAAAFTVAGDAQIIATVPAGAVTGPLVVTTPGGTANSPAAFTVTAAPTLDFSIDGLYLTQGTQTYPATVSLVADRSTWVRVFAKANEANTAQPSVRVTFQAGTAIHTLDIPAPGAAVPTAIQEPDASLSWNASVPSAWIRPGLTVLAQVDPGGVYLEADRTNNRYPPSGTPLALAVESLAPWRIRLLPVTTGDGRTGAVDTSTVASYLALARRIHPVPDALDAAVGPPLTSSVSVLTSDVAAWSTVLDEVTAKWNADGRPAHYFGVVNPAYSSGIVGLGWVKQAVAIGWDRSVTRAGVLAHEVGHNFGRLHAPCGAVTDADPNYPVAGDYAGGHIGVTGWDATASVPAPRAAADYVDIMGYCDPDWVSDYTYKGVLLYRRLYPLPSAAASAAKGLLVWGHLEGDRMVLQPAFPVAAAPAPPVPGPFRWEARDGAGRVRLSADFQPTEVADAPGGRVRAFSFIVPLGAVAASDLQEVRVADAQGVERARTARPAATPLRAGAPEAPVQATDERGAVALVWDGARHPLVVVRDAATGELLGFQRGGAGRVWTERRELELLACDGVQAQVVRWVRPSQ